MTDVIDLGCVYCEAPTEEGQHGCHLGEYITVRLPCCGGRPKHACFPTEGVVVLMCALCQKRSTFTKA